MNTIKKVDKAVTLKLFPKHTDKIINYQIQKNKMKTIIKQCGSCKQYLIRFFYQQKKKNFFKLTV